MHPGKILIKLGESSLGAHVRFLTLWLISKHAGIDLIHIQCMVRDCQESCHTCISLKVDIRTLSRNMNKEGQAIT